MDNRVPDLEGLFEDQGICDFTINTFLALEQEVYEHRALPRPPLSGAQTANRQRGPQFVNDLQAASGFPPQCVDFALQIVDLTHTWSDQASDQLQLQDLLTLIAVMFLFVRTYASPQQRYPRSLPD